MKFNPVQLVVSLLALAAWLVFGGAVLHHIEEADERERAAAYCSTRREVIGLYGGDPTDLYAAEAAVSGGSNCRVIECDGAQGTSDWSFPGATFFALTVFTSIGYGTYVPVTTAGKGFTMFFAIVGYVIFAFVSTNFHKMIFTFQSSQNTRWFASRLMCNLLVFTAWLLLMAEYYAAMEGWTYGNALTRDQVLNYVFIFGSVILSGVCVNDLVRLCYIQQVSDATVSMDSRGIEEEGGNKKEAQLLVLPVYGVYMFFGGAFLQLIEVSGASVGKSSAIDAWNSMQKSGEELASKLGNSSNFALDGASLKLSSLKKLYWSGNYTQDELDHVQQRTRDLMHMMNAAGTCPQPLAPEEKWSVVNGAMFCMTTFTTIGYGNVVPETDVGKVFCVLYSIVGFILYAKVEADTIVWLNMGITRRADHFDRLLYRICCCCKLRQLQYLLVGVLLALALLLFASCAFMLTEGWGFFMAVWFSFVSCCTIGFGDSTPTFIGFNFLIELLLLSVGLTQFALTIHIITQYSSTWLSGLCGSHERHARHTIDDDGARNGELTVAGGPKLVI
eukprot:g1823.t1